MLFFGISAVNVEGSVLPQASRDRCHFKKCDSCATTFAPYFPYSINHYWPQGLSIETGTGSTVYFTQILALEVPGLYNDLAGAVRRLQDKG